MNVGMFSKMSHFLCIMSVRSHWMVHRITAKVHSLFYIQHQ